MTEKTQEEYLTELEARKMPREVVTAEIPNSENLFQLEPPKLAEVLTGLLSLGTITKLVLEVNKPVIVSFYEKTTMGKGFLHSGKSLLSKEAAKEFNQADADRLASEAAARKAAALNRGAVPPPPQEMES